MSQAQTEPTQSEIEMETLYQAAALLKAVYNEISSEYKAKYRMELWRQVEENVAVCARMSSTLPKFLSLLCGKFQVAIPGHDTYEREQILHLLNGYSATPESILKVIREYPQVVTLIVRTQKDAEKAEWKETHDAANNEQ